jgi:tetratricopeptide (TPR) repeat protein
VLASAKSPKPDNPYVTFVAGMSAYRTGRAREALPLLREAAAKIGDRAGPRLALAMALFESGSRAEARRILAEALQGHNWQPSADDRLWVSHVLRREAEALILPDVPPLRGTGGESRGDVGDGDERLALVETYRAKGLYRSAARLMADAFAADPRLADNSTAVVGVAAPRGSLEEAAKSPENSGSGLCTATSSRSRDGYQTQQPLRLVDGACRYVKGHRHICYECRRKVA